MSFVTTPTRRFVLSDRQSAAIRLLLPDPTGPPTPTRSARSAGKEALRLPGMEGCGELEPGGGRRLLLTDGSLVAADRPRGGVDLARKLGDPARAVGGIKTEQLERGARDGRGVVVERDCRDRAVVESGGGADDAEGDRARRRGRGGAVAVDQRRRPRRRRGAQQLRAEAAGDLAQDRAGAARGVLCVELGERGDGRSGRGGAPRAATLRPASARATRRRRASMNPATSSTPSPSLTACSRPSECA